MDYSGRIFYLSVTILAFNRLKNTVCVRLQEILLQGFHSLVEMQGTTNFKD